MAISDLASAVSDLSSSVDNAVAVYTALKSTPPSTDDAAQVTALTQQVVELKNKLDNTFGPPPSAVPPTA